MWNSEPRTTLTIVFGTALMLIAGCGGPQGDLLPFECSIGLWTEDVPYVELAPDGSTPAEMVFGFQGFLWVDAAIQGDEDGPSVADVAVSVTIDGFSPSGTSVPSVMFDGHGEGFLAGPVQMRLDNNEGASLYEGLGADVSMRVRGETHEGVCSAALTLVDEDDCIHTDGEPDCSDDDDSADQ